MAAHGTSACWGDEHSFSNEFIASPYGNGWHLDRQKFDSWLLREACERGIELKSGWTLQKTQRLSVKSQIEKWQLTFRREKQEDLTVSSAFVIDATGRNANFARKQEAIIQKTDQLVAIYRFYSISPFISQRPSCSERKGANQSNLFRETDSLVESHALGWWYSALLPNRQCVVSLMTDADLVKQSQLKDENQWQRLLDASAATKKRVSRFTTFAEAFSSSRECEVKTVPEQSQLMLIAAHSQCLDKPAGKGWLAVGDAASTYDPLSSLGIFKALRHGLLASFAHADYLSEKDLSLSKYQQVITAEYQDYCSKKSDYYAQEKRYQDSLFWQRRHDSQLQQAS
nr:tryptophan 7-halogenase [Aliikangiella sp. G2MR2-5]